MVTKAFILGAGLGTRLRPLTNFLPKPLVPVWNKPIVLHALEHCQDAGITEFAINTHHLPDTWKRFFPSSSYNDLPISFFYEPDLLETGGGIKNIANFIGDDPVLVFNGDIITDMDLKALIHTHVTSDNVVTMALRSKGENCNVAVDGDKVIDIRNSLAVSEGTHQFTGIYCINPEILELIPEGVKISIIPAFLELVKGKKVGVHLVEDASWVDVGTIESYLEIHHSSSEADMSQSWVAPSADVDESATVEKSVIWAKAEIQAGVKMINCIVGEGVEISESIENQIIL